MFAGNLRGSHADAAAADLPGLRAEFRRRARHRRAARDRERGRADHGQAARASARQGARWRGRIHPRRGPARLLSFWASATGTFTFLITSRPSYVFPRYWRRPDGCSGVSRRALLTRAGIGTGAGVFALLGTAAAPALAAASITDLANVRIVCVGKRIAINWLTQLGQHAEGGRQQRHRRPHPRDPQSGAGALRPARAAAERHRPSTTTTPTPSRPARCRSLRPRLELRARPGGDVARHRHRRRVDDRRSDGRRIARTRRRRRRPALLRSLRAHRRPAAPERRYRARSASKTAAISSPSSSPTRWPR